MGLFKRAGRIRLRNATLTTREWSSERGLVEHEASLSNLTELLDLCLDSGAQLPERVILTGVDSEGHERAVSFSFASSVTRGK